MDSKNLSPKGEKEEKYILTREGMKRAQNVISQHAKGRNELLRSVFELMLRRKEPVDLKGLDRILKTGTEKISWVLNIEVANGYVEMIEAS